MKKEFRKEKDASRKGRTRVRTEGGNEEKIER
jgi:hypothetical protein